MSRLKKSRVDKRRVDLGEVSGGELNLSLGGDIYSKGSITVVDDTKYIQNGDGENQLNITTSSNSKIHSGGLTLVDNHLSEKNIYE